MYLFTYAVDDDNTNELYAEFHLGNGQVVCFVKNKPTREKIRILIFIKEDLF